MGTKNEKIRIFVRLMKSVPLLRWPHFLKQSDNQSPLTLYLKEAPFDAFAAYAYGYMIRYAPILVDLTCNFFYMYKRESLFHELFIVQSGGA